MTDPIIVKYKKIKNEFELAKEELRELIINELEQRSIHIKDIQIKSEGITLDLENNQLDSEQIADISDFMGNKIGVKLGKGALRIFPIE